MVRAGPWGVQCCTCHDPGHNQGWWGRICAALLTVGVLLTAIAHGAGAFDLQKVEASVYKIFATPKGSTGTGFLVSGQRTVVTNFHVVGTARSTSSAIATGDGSSWRRASWIAEPASIWPSSGRQGPAGTGACARRLRAREALQRRDRGVSGSRRRAAGQAADSAGAAAALKEPSGLDPTVTSGVVSRMTSAPNGAEPDAQRPHRAAQRRHQSRQQRRAPVRQVRQRHRGSTRWWPSTRRACSSRSTPARWSESCASTVSTMPGCNVPVWPPVPAAV